MCPQIWFRITGSDPIMAAFGSKLVQAFNQMRLRTRIAVSLRLGMAVFLVIAGLDQIGYSML